MRAGPDADPSPPSSAEVKKYSRAVPLLSLRAFVAYERVKPTYLTLRFHVNSHSGSLVFTINLITKENIHAATILLFYVLRRYYLNKRHIYSKIYYHIVQQTYVICRFSHCSSAYSKNHFSNVTHCSSFTYM